MSVVHPQVSIGMPVYNDVEFVSKAIESILNQTYSDFELIISDDFSEDGSEYACREFEALDFRIRYFRQEENIGISRNMRFLLDNAKGEYFMWAADDDLWDREFLKTLVDTLKHDTSLVSVFCPMAFIDVVGKVLSEPRGRATDYSGKNAYERLLKLVRFFDDSFGYGLFRKVAIMDVRFPIWWWINRSCPYNNIYPSLCFYLAKGQFKLVGDRALWFNRLKGIDKINHRIPFDETLVRGSIAFALRKLNLVIYSLIAIYRGSRSLITIFRILPPMIYSWLLVPIMSEFRRRRVLYAKRDISLF